MTALHCNKNDFSEKQDAAITLAANAIHACDVLIVTAGAGMSTESGIADFVDIDMALPEIRNLGLSVFEISNAELFLEKPRLAWGIYGKRMNDYRRASPHEGYGIILKWCRRKANYWVYTSNVDRHFARACFPEERVVECHRSIYEFQCAVPCCDDVWTCGETVIDYDEGTLMAGDEQVPRCRNCDHTARPCTVLATDDRWLGRDTRRREQNMDEQLDKIPLVNSVVILEIGCGVQMPKVRNKSEDLARRFRASGHGTVFIRLNSRWDHLRMPTPSHPGDVSLCTTALLGLKSLDERMLRAKHFPNL